MDDLLRDAAARTIRYHRDIGIRPVWPTGAAVQLDELDEPLPATLADIDVVLNQVLVSFGDPGTTRRVIAGVQADGTCWAGGTVWQGHTAMRISVSSWATTDDDVERSLATTVRVAEGVRGAAHGG